jgi:hypothetical protein
LADVPEDYVFRCCDGQILRNMKEFGDALNTMTHETYVFHANTMKNDFANWARHNQRRKAGKGTAKSAEPSSSG